jgi:xanthine dehydrogenase molybdopterin binding subunit/xanthine dehydrogenase small subunit
MDPRFELTVNGKVVTVEGQPARRSLLDHLRAIGLTGSKQGCAEGDCGACTALLVDTDASGRRVLRTFTTCITPLPLVAGREVITVEGVAARADGALHPVQRAMVERYGSQCGYCTPGFIASMVEAFYRDEVRTLAGIADQLCGNLCRCTGYRPIRDALADAIASRGSPPGPDAFHAILRRPAAPLAGIAYAAAGEVFLRPTSLAELLRLLDEHPEAEIVAGATEIGVEINKRGKRHPLLISTEGVADLRAITAGPEGFRVGGAATLTALEEALAGEHPAVDAMIRVFASRQIRNRATLAGNLVTASPIGDMAPVLLALDARVEIVSSRGAREVPIDAFFTGYRRTALSKGELVRAVILPRGGAPSGPGPFGAPAGLSRRTASYKVSKRRELDISIVAAAFSVDLDTAGVVRRARLAYGGVAPTPARAREAEALIEGRPWTGETVASVLPTLAQAFTPIGDARGSAEYRRALVVSLFEKFFDGAADLAQDDSLDDLPRSAPAAVHRAEKALPHESGALHVTGAAVYVDDQAQRRSMLEIWPVCSPHAHARIVRRDASRARGMPGVVAVLMAEDVPGRNDVGAVRADEILLADREAMFHGHLVAVVVGESYEACRAAAAAVDIEYEPLPAVLGIDQAIAAGSFHTEPHVIRRGDVDAALAASPHRLDGQLATGGQEHFYLETHAAWAERGEDGDVFVCSSTQHPSEVQAAVAHVLHLPRSKVVVESPRMGGGFGGKETQGNTWAALVALAAWHTRRPVRVQLDRDVDMRLTGKRHPFCARFSCGFDEEGRVLGLRMGLVSDGGWALDLSASICDRALFHLDNAYYLPNVEFSGRVARTNVVSHTAFRGFGGPQGMVVIEEVMDRIARRLGLHPEVVRERNFYRGGGETSTTHYGQLIEDSRVPAMWRTLLESAHFAERRAEIARYNARSPRRKRGIAVTPVKFGISFTASFLNQAGALVHVYRDGTVQVSHGGTEMGQGLYTKIRGVAMRELGLPEGAIRVMKTSTDKVPNTSATAASSGADLNGAAVREACATLRARLAPVAAGLLGEGVTAAEVVFADGACRAGNAALPFAAVVERAYLAQVSLSATGFYRTPGIGYDRTTGRGQPFYYFAGGVAVSEVVVEGYTGMKRLLRVDILHDVGDSLNPGIDLGQIEGGFVQGAGWLTGEELVWDAEGRLLTSSASTYQIPSFGDTPAELHVTLLPDAAQRGTIHGSKAVGEPPLMLAISVREAIRDAVAAFGPPGGEVPLAVPATHEAIFMAIADRLRLAPTVARRG